MRIKVKGRHLALIILILAMLIPNVKFFSISFLGITFSFYRLAIPCIACYCLYKKRCCKIGLQEYAWLLLFVLWIMYGIIQMAIIPTLDLRGSVKELLELLLGGLSIYACVALCNNSGDLKFVISIIRIILSFCIVLGIIEIFTGWHLETSCFNDKRYIQNVLKSTGSYINTHFATGFQYGVNDYCAFITFFSPVYLVKSKKYNVILNGVFLVLALLLCLRNDAIICALGLIIGIVFYLWSIKAYVKKNILVFATSFCLLAILYYIAGSVYSIHLKKTLEISSIKDVILAQIKNMHHATGSLYARLKIYIDSLKSLEFTSFMGLGPNGFSDYFIRHPSDSGLINPHNFWLEILTQYGIGVFICYVGLLIAMFHKLYIYYKTTSNGNAIIICTIFIIYVIVSIAPSSFLGYSYQWLAVAMALVFIRHKRRDISNGTEI